MARKERKYHYIYKIICLKNNKYYIGMHSTDNLEDGYFGGGKRIKRSVRKHGKENHRKEILEFFENREKLRDREEKLVNIELLKDPMCMNLKLGGEGWCCSGIRIGGDNWKKCNEMWESAEGKKLKSDISKRRWENKEYREKMSDISKGNKTFTFLNKTHSIESKRKIGESNILNHLGEKNPQFGTCWITNEELKENKKIKREDINSIKYKNWKLGRKYYTNG